MYTLISYFLPLLLRVKNKTLLHFFVMPTRLGIKNEEEKRSPLGKFGQEWSSLHGHRLDNSCNVLWDIISSHSGHKRMNEKIDGKKCLGTLKKISLVFSALVRIIIIQYMSWWVCTTHRRPWHGMISLHWFSDGVQHASLQGWWTGEQSKKLD